MSESKEPSTILIVDDEAMLGEIISLDFKRKGYKTLQALSGKEAIEVIKNNHVDLVLTDIKMPNGDGLELLKSIKEGNYDIPVVMLMTGYSDVSTEQAYGLGADAIFTKPFNQKILHDSISTALLPKEERWSKLTEISTDIAIDLQFPELKTAIATHAVSIGRGGMFVLMKEKFPHVGNRAEFNMTFTNEASLAPLKGTGIVQWVRAVPSNNLATGCGIEFVYLQDEAKKAIVEIIEKSKIKPYIPIQ